jgi:16S rRNA processing protein RimM
VEPRTDEPERRFADGAVLRTRTPSGSAPSGPDRPASLTVERTRWHQSRLLVTFAELADRTAAEAVRGLTLVTDVDATETPEDPEEYYDHQLVGLAVVTTDGAAVGEVVEVLHGAGQDLLSVRTAEGREVLVPFVTALVPVVDVDAGRVEVADRPGLITPLDEV